MGEHQSLVPNELGDPRNIKVNLLQNDNDLVKGGRLLKKRKKKRKEKKRKKRATLSDSEKPG